MPVDELDDDVGDDDVKKGGRDRGGRGKPAGGAVAGPGLSPLYLSDAGLDKYSMKKGTRVTDIVAFKLLPKADIIKEIEELGDQCDFFALKDAMQVREKQEPRRTRTQRQCHQQQPIPEAAVTLRPAVLRPLIAHMYGSVLLRVFARRRSTRAISSF
jgi:hypothetical protein